MPEVGYQSSQLGSWMSYALEAHEANPLLRWPFSIEVYDKMRREDSQVGSVIRAVTLPIRGTKWMIDGTGCRDEVTELVAGDLGLPIKGRDPAAPLRTRGRFTWKAHLPLALLELVHGHSVFEQVYMEELDALGRRHLKKLAYRPPRSISKFEVARDGGLVAIHQHGLDQPLSVDRLVVYVNDPEGANWRGSSVLRQAYKDWVIKDRIIRAQAGTIERNGLGVPVYKSAPVPDGVTGKERDDWLASEKEAGLKLAKGFRSGLEAGVSIPHGSELSLMGVTGKLPETLGPIRYHDAAIARAVLANFLTLGGDDSTGSYALGDTFEDFFTQSLNAVAQHIEDVTQQHVVEDLVDENYGPTEPAPRIVASPIGAEHPATAEGIRALIECGALSADPALEAHLRARYAMPVKQVVAEDTAGGFTDAEVARAVAEVVQKSYLGVGPVLTRREARDLARRAGAQLDAANDAVPVDKTTEVAA